MDAREVTRVEVEFYGGPWDGRCDTLRLPLPSRRHIHAERGYDTLLPCVASGHLATVTYRLRPGPRGLRYELERERV